ncbi:MAG: response regulator [Candidatus Marinimicrobia bacterium]|nr:response regulator [Candidatus Neomarinimicrobiota bacterium]MCH8069731.1 response regulator [Candidatus Neomarinimicrobiota bacterium]
MTKKKILIVDDEKFFIEPIKRFLDKNDFETITANDGFSGIISARKEMPDLIILDLMLPKINGFQVCRLLKFDDKYKHIPIIIVSAKDTDKDKELGKISGSDMYITKPINPKTLVDNINAILT